MVKSILLWPLFFISNITFAYTAKEGNVTANIGPFFSKTNYEGQGSHKNSFLAGTGFVATGDLNTSGALEISMFYMRKAYFREDAANFIAERTYLMHIGMGYRWWLQPRFSTSLTFTSSYTMGEPQMIFSNLNSGQEIKTSATDITDYGIDLAAQYEIYQSSNLALIIDARYGYNLTSKAHERGDHFGALLALRYLVQEKNPSPLPKRYKIKK